MRTLLSLAFTCCLTFGLFAQAPQHFNYQAVARNAQGQVIIGQIEARFSLLADSPAGTIHYREQHVTETNAQGIFHLIIGDGNAIQGQLSNLEWASHEYWIRVEIKVPGDNDFTVMGTSQLLSVPYALHAATSNHNLESGAGIEIINHTISNTGDLSEINELQSLSLNGNQLSLSQGGGTVTLPETTSDTWAVSGNTISNSPNSSRVAIGTTQSTDARLHVRGKELDGMFISSEEGAAIRAVSDGPYGAGYFTGHEGVAGFFTSVSNYCLYAHQGSYGNAATTQGILLKNGGENWNMFIDINKDYNFAYNNVLKAWIYDTDGSYHNSSDRSLKKNIRSRTNVLPGLLQLQAYTYHMKSASDDSPVSLGFMADEVEAVFPELVAEKEGHKTLCYDHFAVLSVEAIKEQQAQIEALTLEVEALKVLIAELKLAVSSSTGN